MISMAALDRLARPIAMPHRSPQADRRRIMPGSLTTMRFWVRAECSRWVRHDRGAQDARGDQHAPPARRMMAQRHGKTPVPKSGLQGWFSIT